MKKLTVLVSLVLLLGLVIGCPNDTPKPEPTHIPVTDITGVVESVTTGIETSLLGTVEPETATKKDIVWSIKDAGETGVTELTEGNKFTAQNAGNLIVSATIKDGKKIGEDYTKDFTITVTSPAPVHVAVTDITGTIDVATINVEATLEGTVAPETATNKTIVWSIKDAGTTGVTEITDGNKFTAQSAGTLTVTATVKDGKKIGEDYTKDFTINVTATPPAHIPVTGITGVPAIATINTEVNLTSAKVSPNNATNQNIVWSIKDAGETAVTTEDVQDGTFTPTKTGTLTVTAAIVNGATETTDFTKDFTITIQEEAPPTHVAVTDITDETTTATAGIQAILTGMVAPATATNKTIVWSVKDTGTTGVTTLIGGNKFTATSAGTLTVTATVKDGVAMGEDYTKDFEITVNAGFEAVTNITIATTEAVSGTEFILRPTVEPNNATNQNITWSVVSEGGTGVTNADVQDGTFTATTAGTLKVKATIANGTTDGTDYIKEFDINVTAKGFPSGSKMYMRAVVGGTTRYSHVTSSLRITNENVSNLRNAHFLISTTASELGKFDDVVWSSDEIGIGKQLNIQFTQLNGVLSISSVDVPLTGGELITFTATAPNGESIEFSIRLGEPFPNDSSIIYETYFPATNFSAFFDRSEPLDVTADFESGGLYDMYIFIGNYINETSATPYTKTTWASSEDGESNPLVDYTATNGKLFINSITLPESGTIKTVTLTGTAPNGETMSFALNVGKTTNFASTAWFKGTREGESYEPGSTLTQFTTSSNNHKIGIFASTGIYSLIYADAKWESSDTSKATVTKLPDGYVEVDFKEAGTVTITAEDDSGIAKSIIYKIQEVASISLDFSDLTLSGGYHFSYIGSRIEIPYTLTPASASINDVIETIKSSSLHQESNADQYDDAFIDTRFDTTKKVFVIDSKNYSSGSTSMTQYPFAIETDIILKSNDGTEVVLPPLVHSLYAYFELADGTGQRSLDNAYFKGVIPLEKKVYYYGTYYIKNNTEFTSTKNIINNTSESFQWPSVSEGGAWSGVVSPNDYTVKVDINKNLGSSEVITEMVDGKWQTDYSRASLTEYEQIMEFNATKSQVVNYDFVY